MLNYVSEKDHVIDTRYNAVSKLNALKKLFSISEGKHIHNL